MESGLLCDFEYQFPDALCGAWFAFLYKLIAPVDKAVKDDALLAAVQLDLGFPARVQIIVDIDKAKRKVGDVVFGARIVVVAHGIEAVDYGAEVAAVEFDSH